MGKGKSLGPNTAGDCLIGLGTDDKATRAGLRDAAVAVGSRAAGGRATLHPPALAPVYVARFSPSLSSSLVVYTCDARPFFSEAS